MLSYKIISLGCKVNIYEAEAVANELNLKGYKATDDDLADIYILFTCAVTNTAESKTRKKINQIKKKNDDSIIVVVGCYVQLNYQELVNDLRINILVGSNEKNKIVLYIENYLNNHKQIVKVNNKINTFNFDKLNVLMFNKQTRAYLKIQDGCNQFCSFCIIPFARGHERSMEMDECINQAKLLSMKHQEIVLTGIHTGRYHDSKNNKLYDLLLNLVKIDSLKRIRLSSIEITEINDDIIDLILNNNKIARHLHIPLQSGDDDILQLMNRPYTTKNYTDRIKYIRNKIPNISISTDLIVGFPNELDNNFNNTYNFIKELKLSFIHVFPYAKKINTKASYMDNQITNDIKKSRVKNISELSTILYEEYLNSFIDKEVEVLIEKNEDGYSIGHCSEYFIVKIQGIYKPNTMIKVIVKDIVANIAISY